MFRNNNLKRIFIYILVVLLAFSAVPMSVWADDEDTYTSTQEGQGDEEEYALDDEILQVLSYSLEPEEIYLGDEIIDQSAIDFSQNDTDTENAQTYSVEMFTENSSYEDYEYWESFSSEYYYNQLETDEERAFWKGLEKVCDTLLYTEKDSPGYTDFVVFKGYKSADADRVKEIQRLFYFSNPQYYFIKNGRVSYSIGGEYYFGLMVYDDFIKGSTRKEATAQYKSAIDKSIKEINSGNDLETIRQIYDYICETTEYNNYAASNVDAEEETKSQSGYSCLVYNNTVCAGYAQATMLLCNYFDIDAVEVVSNSHAWNLVKCDDNWYQIDSTWGDQISFISYRYFMKSYDNYQSVTNGNYTAHTVLPWMDRYIPVATQNSIVPNIRSGDGITIPDTNDAISGSYSMSSANGRYTVSLYADNANADIYYTLEGSAPDEAKVKCYKYKTPIVTESESVAKNIRFIVVCDKYYDSDILSTSDAGTNMKISPYGYVGRSAADTIIFDMYFKMDSASYNNPDISVKAQNSSGNLMEYKMSELSLVSYNSSDKTYIVSIPIEVKPKEMTNICSAQFYMGKEPISEIYEQRFAEYLKAILSQYSEGSKEYKCAYKLAQLGDASQLYFTYNTDALASKYTGVKANNGSGSDLSMAKSLKTYHDSTFVDTSDMCDMVGVSLSLKDTIAVNYYISVEDGFKLSSFSAYNDDEFVVTKVSDNLIKVSVQNIPYTSIKKIYHHQLCYEDKLVLIIDYSISDYVANVLSSSSANASLKTLCRALFSFTA